MDVDDQRCTRIALNIPRPFSTWNRASLNDLAIVRMGNRYRLAVHLLFFVLAQPAAAAVGDTTDVRVFDAVLMGPHGFTGRWAVFPDSTKRYEKILMHFRLKCPSGGCGEWDYTTNVYVRHHTGIPNPQDTTTDIIEDFEIGRFITPYGKYYREGREFVWVYDVTDYAFMLRDSVDIQTFYDGWSQGSLYTLDFELIEGVPARDVFRVENLYVGGFTYGDTNNPIEARLPEKTISVDARSTNTTLKITTSGHGFGGTDNAGEFADKTHSVKVNGQKRFNQRLWRDDCGQNPVYPQAGTWYYPRAGWCPGDIVYPHFFDLSPYVTPGAAATVDYDMQPYINRVPSKGASYIIQAQVLYASGPNFANNVAIDAILRPNSAFPYRRMNPICESASPLIVIRNVGREALTSTRISYGTPGAMRSFDWTGNLGFNTSDTVELPAAIVSGSGTATFVASVSVPNGAEDEYPRDNTMQTQFMFPKRSSGTLYLTLRTDDFDNDELTKNGIRYEVRDADDNVVHTREGFEDRAIYKDTIRLSDGCYRFIIYDEYYADGLIPIVGTAGSYVLRDNKNVTIINGQSNGPDYFAGFGDREVTSFVVSNTSGVDDVGGKSGLDGINIFPNPTDGTFTVDVAAINRRGDLDIVVSDIEGKEILRSVIDSNTNTVAVDLRDNVAGTYVVRIDGRGGSWLGKVVITSK